MRITLHLDTFECAEPSVYAILWLDRDARKWSREGHAVIDLPEWGTLALSHECTRVLDATDGDARCELQGLDLLAVDGPFEGESGRVLWHCGADRAPVVGQWHVQWIDDTDCAPEHGVFADEF
ncbi:DUF3564 family protein [Burkholderia sp. Ac-20365]|uniref:DUF3564 family protein n=1 Tax=Burkholderia sp. Ac-20365 TaxID=2703897 RepID=UPI00197BAF03|nr:DUF3564 family protein [Burkholderia sp. Ac-20365]MBN3759739.1 DUF3564 domain-containing protein [Burkholderia sp. Ac-20365]